MTDGAVKVDAEVYAEVVKHSDKTGIAIKRITSDALKLYMKTIAPKQIEILASPV